MTTTTIAIGIDPGVSGGIALVCSRRGLLATCSMPAMATGSSAKPGSPLKRMVDARALRVVLSVWSTRHDFAAADDVVLVVEKMATFGGPAAAKDKAPRDTLLSMGVSSGIAEGVGIAFSRRTLRPLPQQWKGTYGLVIRRPRVAGLVLPAESTTDRKRRAHKVALMLYPTMGRVSHDVAEAVLIAHWGLGMPAPIVAASAQREAAEPLPF